MRTRTFVAAIAGLVVAVIAYRFFHVAVTAPLRATGVLSALRHVFTARALFYVLVTAAGLLAVAAACALFLLIAGKFSRKRWKRGLLWAAPALPLCIALSFAIGVPAETAAVLLGATVSMLVAHR